MALDTLEAPATRSPSGNLDAGDRLNFASWMEGHLARHMRAFAPLRSSSPAIVASTHGHVFSRNLSCRHDPEWVPCPWAFREALGCRRCQDESVARSFASCPWFGTSGRAVAGGLGRGIVERLVEFLKAANRIELRRLSYRLKPGAPGRGPILWLVIPASWSSVLDGQNEPAEEVNGPGELRRRYIGSRCCICSAITSPR